MTNVRVAFDILKDGDRAPIGHKYINCHLIYDVKMEDFRRKALLVASGHMIETTKCMTYSSVVGLETVRISLTIAVLNNLHVKAGDVMNAYVTAPCSEKIWTVLGKEFGNISILKFHFVLLSVKDMIGIGSSNYLAVVPLRGDE